MYKKYVTFSFDDGLEQDKRIIQLMKKYGLKGTFNLNSGLMGKKQLVGGIGTLGFVEVKPDARRLRALNYVEQFRIPEDEIAQVYEGFEVASHAYRHEPLGLISKEKMEESVDLDLENLERIVGYQIRGHAYAKGMGSKAAGAYLKQKGIVYARAVKTTGTFSFPEDPYNYQPSAWHIQKDVFEVIDRFLRTDPVQEDMLLYIWGHGYECDFNEREASWGKLERIFAMVAGKQDLVYCTNIEAFDDHNHRKGANS